MLRRVAAAVAVLAAGFLVATLLAPGTAGAAENCWMQAVKGEDGSIHYVKVCENVDPGGPGTPGGGPSCDLASMGPPMAGFSGWYCKGAEICANRENIVPLAPPSTPAPEGQTWVREDCFSGPGAPTGTALVLSGTVARPLIVQAQEAFGNLAPPTGIVRHSPADRAVVRLPTWLWLDPGSFGELRGSSAEGLVAVAVPDGTTWKPGDGTSKACAGGGTPGGPGCTHTYGRANPAYHGSVTRRWAVHYENGGAEIDIPGAPAVLTAETGFDLAVVETQVVTGN